VPKPKALTPDQAKRTIAARIAPRIDRVRQIATRLGIRPYRVMLVWTRFDGAERGEGDEVEARRIEILPTPKVEDLSAVTLNPLAAGVLPMGTIRVSEVSATMTSDLLNGRWVPRQHEEHLPEPYAFYYEVVEDGRGDSPAARQRYRLAAQPFLKADDVQWVLLLERVSEDAHRDGTSRYGEGS
jgi:hypothetical protein